MFWIDSYYRNIFPDSGLFEWIQTRQGKVYRTGVGRTTLRFEHQGCAYFLKRYHGVGWIEISKNLLQARWPVIDASNEWYALQHLKRHHMLSLYPVACGVSGINPAKRFSFLITCEMQAMISIETVVLTWQTQQDFMFKKRQLIMAIADLARKMHRSGLNHRDFYICHLYISREWLNNQASDINLTVIDLHRAQIRPSVPYRWQVKDIGSLYFSSQNCGLTRNDYLRFMKQYTRQSLRQLFSVAAPFLSDVQRRAKQLHNQ